VWYWRKKRQISQWNRIESPQIDPYKCSQLIFPKEAKAIKWKKDILTNGARTTGHPHAKKKEGGDLDTDTTLFTKVNSKWITDLNVKHKMTKLLDYNIVKI